MSFILTITLLSFIIYQSNSLAFHLYEDRERCFHDEYTINTVVIGTHRLLDQIPTSQQKEGVTLRVIDPDLNQVLIKQTGNEEGKFTFTTRKAGKHQVCLKLSTKNAFTNQRALYMIRLKQGNDLEYQNAAKENHINGLKLSVLQLQNAERDFIKLQEMNRENEDKLSQENIKINDRVLKATIFQTVVILAAGIFQIVSLRKFFSKKLFF